MEAVGSPVVLATANAGKAAELRHRLGDVVELVDRPADLADVAETGATLVANARIKAQALVEATGLWALADDTGLEVEALDGAPGVHSARFAGPAEVDDENVALLLDRLEGVASRRAKFRTVLVLLGPDGSEVTVEGAVEGEIATSRRGSNGFGYDPVFVPDGSARTFAEMSLEEKQQHSHRGRAIDALRSCDVFA